MTLIFLYGHAASGKLTVGRALAAQTGFPLFHNHLVVDAVASVFPFGSPQFAKLRERWWLEMIEAAARGDQSLIFTFAPEASVAADFPQRAKAVVEAAGGDVLFVKLIVGVQEQLRRIDNADRAQFGKLRDPALLQALRPQFEACLAAMPDPAVTIDTRAVTPDDAAALIVAQLQAAARG
ncbi:shikimate kinase [Sphingobium sp. CR28]|uniref:shikimate kinase n=1 Tax=Sphingobium sp. CR28 TaxID=3400272 RepID=UPI003FF0C6CE